MGWLLLISINIGGRVWFVIGGILSCFVIKNKVLFIFVRFFVVKFV